MQNGILLIDTLGSVVYQNPVAGKLLASPWSKTDGGEAPRRDSILPDLIKLAQDAAGQSMEIIVGTGSIQEKYRIEVVSLMDPDGLCCGYLLIFHDITERERDPELLLDQQRALATLEERERIARELHDEFGQVLGYVKLQAQAVRDLLTKGDSSAADLNLAQLVSITQDAHDDLREYILGSQSASFLGEGFLPVLRQYLERFSHNFGLSARLLVHPDFEMAVLEPTVEAQLLRIIQEALTNARKHARASYLTVRFELLENQVQVSIEDDGQGFDLSQVPEGQALSFGQGIMRERAEMFGGSLEVISAPEQGTRVIVRVPRGKESP